MFLTFKTDVDPIVVNRMFVVTSLMNVVPLLPNNLNTISKVVIMFCSITKVSTSIDTTTAIVRELVSF